MSSGKHCPTCQCEAQPPTYPVTCDLCGIEYGPTSEIKTHRPASMSCLMRRYSRDLLSDESLSRLEKRRAP